MIRSIGLLFLVSSAAALFFSEFNITFWKTFLFILIVQLVCWNIYTTYQRTKLIKIQQEIEREFVQNLQKQEVQISCAACNHEHFIPVDINDANTFQCEACEQKNTVYINIETAAMTVVDDVKER